MTERKVDAKEILAAKTAGPPRLKTLYVPNDLAEHTNRSGTATVDCLETCCWFHVGGKRDVPSKSQCCLIGHFCGTYVGVPESGRDQLTKLTLAVLDFAINDPPKPAPAKTRKVVAYIKSDGKIVATNEDDAAFQVKGTIPFMKPGKTLLKAETSAEAAEAAKASVRAAQADAETARADVNAARAAAETGKTALREPINAKMVVEIVGPRKAALERSASALAVDIQNNAPLKMNDISPEAKEVFDAAMRLSQVTQQLDLAEKRLDLAEQRINQAIRIQNSTMTELPEPIEVLPPRRTSIPGAGYLQFDQNLRTLTPPSSQAP